MKAEKKVVSVLEKKISRIDYKENNEMYTKERTGEPDPGRSEEHERLEYKRDGGEQKNIE